MMVYLSSPKSGGFTTFPQLGITVPPVQVLLSNEHGHHEGVDNIAVSVFEVILVEFYKYRI